VKKNFIALRAWGLDFTHANLKMAYSILRKNRVSRRRTIKYGIVLIR